MAGSLVPLKEAPRSGRPLPPRLVRGLEVGNPGMMVWRVQPQQGPIRWATSPQPAIAVATAPRSAVRGCPRSALSERSLLGTETGTVRLHRSPNRNRNRNPNRHRSGRGSTSRMGHYRGRGQRGHRVQRVRGSSQLVVVLPPPPAPGRRRRHRRRNEDPQHRPQGLFQTRMLKCEKCMVLQCEIIPDPDPDPCLGIWMRVIGMVSREPAPVPQTRAAPLSCMLG